jgi:hypothetical protein
MADATTASSRHPGALEQPRLRGIRRALPAHDLGERDEVALGAPGGDDVARLAQGRGARLDHDARPACERVIRLARIGLVRPDRDDGRVVGDQRAVEQRLARGRAAADDVRRGDQVIATGVVATEQPYVADGPDRADRGGVRVCLRPPPEDDQACGVVGREMSHGQGRHGRRAQVRDGDPVDQRQRRERVAVEDDADALDARPAANGDELDGRLRPQPGRHDEQLPGIEVDGLAEGVGFGVQAAQQGGLERVRRLGEREPLLDLRSADEPQAHRSTNPVPSGSRGSRTNRCSPVRKAVPSTSVSTPSGWVPTPALRSPSR